MTAAEQVHDESQLRTFRAAVDDYLARNRHREPTSVLSRNAQLAGLNAVRGDWERHPGDGEVDLTGHIATTSLAEKDRLKAAGWTCCGASHIYLLAPPSADSASPVDGAP